MRFRQRQPKSEWRVVLEYVLYIVAAIGIAFLIVKFVAVRSIVDGTSMEPFVNNTPLRFGLPLSESHSRVILPSLPALKSSRIRTEAFITSVPPPFFTQLRLRPIESIISFGSEESCSKMS